MYCDLHTHSVFSDGTFTPEEIIKKAQSLRACAVALTDHDSIDGLPRFMKAARGTGIKAVCGAEFSTDYKGKELHIPGLFIPPGSFPEVKNYVGNYLRGKEKSNENLINKLCEAGYEISYEEIKRKNPGSLINRAHIAEELTLRGYVASINEAFAGVLSEKKGFYVPNKRPDTLETIKFILSVGAVPVLAHPFINLSEEELDSFLNEAVPCGLKAVETYCSHYGEDKREKALAAVKKYGLLESGGSDFHGERKPDISLLTGKGDLFIPCSVYEKLYECSLQIKKKLS